MIILRKKPGFSTDETVADIMRALLIGLISISAFILFFSGAFWAVQNRKFGASLGLFVLTIISALQTNMCIQLIREKLSALIKKNKWIKNALNQDVMIVDRKIEYNPYAEYREEEYECELILQIPAFQTTIDSDKQIVRAFVSKQIYDQYIRRDIAKVFFCATDSLVIHIEGE